MSRHQVLNQVLEQKLVAILRTKSSTQLVSICEALVRGGITCIEITMTVPGALESLSTVNQALGDRLTLGAGTILDPETARLAILAGARFIVSPVVNLDTIRMCHRYDVLTMPGAFTPTEILTAWDAGADVIKLFPADAVGAQFLRALKGPFPQVRLMPTGGVNLKNLPEFFKAGACAVGLGSQLVDAAAAEAGRFDEIEATARQYVELTQRL